MEQIINYIKPELLVLIPVLYFIGIGLKKSEASDTYIPIILGAIGVLLATLYVVATSSYAGVQDVVMSVFVGVTQGVLCSGCSVYVNQIIKQNKK